MRCKYKFHNPEGIYFVSFATVNWIDLFIRETYFQIMIDIHKGCIENKELLLYSWCIMPSHVHLIFRSLESETGKFLGNLKTFTSKVLLKEILEGYDESRKEWILLMVKYTGLQNRNVNSMQLWQQESSDRIMEA